MIGKTGNCKKVAATVALSLVVFSAAMAEKRNEVSYLRGAYNTAFFWRHNDSFRVGSALHFSHAKQHDVLLLTPLRDHEKADRRFDRESVAMLKRPPRTEPTQEYYAPYTARTFWLVLRAIDWTHMLHEQTYDILSDRNIPWDEKKVWTDRTVRYYLENNDIPRSPAPLDVTMRRAGVMMKPYFTYFRNYYPQSNNFFYAAHWWHPIIYEAMMVGGNGFDQERTVREVERTFQAVLRERPKRMLLTREVMPRYARLSPEAGNIFDNLHMLHGITYDILAGFAPRRRCSVHSEYLLMKGDDAQTHASRSLLRSLNSSLINFISGAALFQDLKRSIVLVKYPLWGVVWAIRLNAK